MARKERGRQQKEQSEFDQRILDLRRVTRVTAGGKRMRFRATIVIGDHVRRVGIGVAKGADVSMAIQKAFNDAKRQVVTIVTHKDTIPHAITASFGAANVLLKPAPRGTGIIAGGVVRNVLEFGGVKNVVAKILGCRNKLNNARATVAALASIKRRMPIPARTAKVVKNDVLVQ